jgi:hypothetical protein
LKRDLKRPPRKIRTRRSQGCRIGDVRVPFWR